MMSEVEVIKCEFKNYKWRSFGYQYSLYINNQKFEIDKEYQLDITDCRDVNEVFGIFIKDCCMPSIPHNFPWHQFPNVKILSIYNSNITTISKDDFEGLNKENLKGVYFEANKIEYVPGDLLEGMNKLERASFGNNKIKYIDAELTPSLMKLKYLDFERNININKEYAEESNISMMKKIIDAIFDKCLMPDDVREKTNQFHTYKNHFKKALNEKRNIQKENLQLTTKNRELKTEIGELKQTVNNWKESVAAGMKNALKNENTKDFTITVNDQEFKVHKFLLIARSPVLAEMIQNNPDANVLNLKDIPTDVFEQVLDFLYNDTLPQDGATFKDIFIAAGRLKIEKQKNFAGDELMDQVDEENACDMLALSNKYLHKGLRIKAFEEVNKILDEEDSGTLENAQKHKELKRKRETASKKFEEAFKKLKK